jgi:cytochrome c-type biogenesis protein CcmH/NrfG
VPNVPARGLPPRIYVPIVIVGALAFLSLVGYFLKIGLGVEGAALGPTAQQGDANIQVAPGPNGVGGGSPDQAAAPAAPPVPVMRLLTELRGRIQRRPDDVEALDALGNLYADAAKYSQAIVYYERARAVAPGNPRVRADELSALLGEGVVAQSSGRRSDAVAAYKRFLVLAPADRRAPEVRAGLRRLGG